METFSTRIEGFSMSNVYQFVSPNADPVAQHAFFDALKSKSCTHLAHKLVALRTELVNAEGALGILAEYVSLGITGEVELCERLTAEAGALGTLTAETRTGNVAYGEFVKAARLKFARPTHCALRTELDVGSVQIPELEAKIRGFERERAAHRERLLEAGLDDQQIDYGNLLKPTVEDLAEWNRTLEAKREQLTRATAFLETGPLFDLSIISGEGVHAGR
ncbi:hypothetical protein PQQ99_09740 [Paraburkholderia sediminicola]|uniref:hypothetical protein n=1 Tax=Paraburkholderia sediminicola TaxID=458836 RepID=UPI0038B6EE27